MVDSHFSEQMAILSDCGSTSINILSRLTSNVINCSRGACGKLSMVVDQDGSLKTLCHH